MHHILGEIMLAGGNKNLGAGDFVAAIRLLHRLGAQHSQIGAAMRLGEVHRAGPGAGDHLRQIFVFLLRRGVRDQRGNRALRKTGIHREGHVGRTHEFIDDQRQRGRQSLSAIFHRRGDPDPAAVDHLLVSFLKTLGRGHAAIIMALAAFDVAAAVERQQHFFAQLGGFAQHCLHHIGGGVGEAGKIVVTFDMEDVIQQKEHVVHRSLIGRHGRLRALGAICSNASIAGAKRPPADGMESRIQITLTSRHGGVPGPSLLLSICVCLCSPIW